MRDNSNLELLRCVIEETSTLIQKRTINKLVIFVLLNATLLCSLLHKAAELLSKITLSQITGLRSVCVNNLAVVANLAVGGFTVNKIDK